MMVYSKAEEVTSEIKKLRENNLLIGFVPTMGALHQGHLSLVEKAGAECDVVVVSIFVNPTQFNNPDDLKRYPRTLEKDIDLLEGTPAKIVFAPTVDEIYPNKEAKKTDFEFGNLERVLEAKHRPGHFDGVAMVVKRFFEIVQPSKAYFGQKDIQQYLIIKQLNDNYLQNLNIEVVKCPIIREKDGLAMSSRNVLLTHEQRKSAALISQALFEAKNNYSKYAVQELIDRVIAKINTDKNLEVEYFEVVKEPDLTFIKDWSQADKVLACIAVNAGKVRLIDNIYFS
jgi:pantoate--beta-alanine ligase